jgi:hypothetical protein
MKMLFTLAAALSTVLSASAAMATSYSGNWPLTVTDSKGFNGNHCLALTDDGGFGWPHSGFGTLDGTNFASFQVIGNTIEAVVQDEGQEVEGTVITARAKQGSLGNGVFAIILAGESVDSGKVAFGTKGGC